MIIVRFIRHQRTLHRNLNYLIQFDPSASHHLNNLPVRNLIFISYTFTFLVLFSHPKHSCNLIQVNTRVLSPIEFNNIF
jgi:hypothetical protein